MISRTTLLLKIFETPGYIRLRIDLQIWFKKNYIQPGLGITQGVLGKKLSVGDRESGFKLI